MKKTVAGLCNRRVTVTYVDNQERIYKCEKREKIIRDPHISMDREISMLCKYCREDESLEKDNK